MKNLSIKISENLSVEYVSISDYPAWIDDESDKDNIMDSAQKLAEELIRKGIILDEDELIYIPNSLDSFEESLYLKRTSEVSYELSKDMSEIVEIGMIYEIVTL